MIVSPGEKRDYIELLEVAIAETNKLMATSENLNIEDIKGFYSIKNETQDEGLLLIVGCIIEIMKKQYECIADLDIVDDEKYSANLLKFYKIIIYDLYDYKNAMKNFIGIQLQNISRSVIEHTRMFIICLLDREFEKYYFAGYDSQDDKKERYYKKSGTKIDKKIADIYKKAIENKQQNCEVAPSELLFAINSEQYKRIHDQFSELSHLNEFIMAEKLVDLDNKLNFYDDKTKKYDKYYDDILEYLIASSIIIFLIHIDRVEYEIDDESINLYNLLVKIYNSLFKYRCFDTLLIGLKTKIQEIMQDS